MPPSPGTDLALYVHWPYCARICPYCDFNVVRDRGRVEEQAALVEAVLADMTAQAALTGPRRLASIFFGGGTPSLMLPEAVAAVIDSARTLFPPRGPIEITLEANPTDAEAARFAALAGAGVNIEDIRMATMGDLFTMIALVGLDRLDGDFRALQGTLDAAAADLGVQAHIYRREIFDAMHRI